MEKINIAELLRNCPRDMELDCTMFDDVKFIAVDEAEKPICIRTGVAYRYLTKFGTWTFDENAKCVIFPKGKTSWEGFVPPCQFKDGDIAVSDKGDIHLLRTEDSSYCAYRERWKGLSKFDKTITTSVKVERLATEEEKEKLFKAIKDNGYRWNEETKTLEEFPKFNVGDRIKWIKTGNIYEIIKIFSNCYIAKYLGSDITILFNRQDEYELVPVEPKFKVGDRIRTKKNAPITLSNILITKVKSSSYEGVIGDTTNPAHINFKYQDLYELAPIEPKFKVGDRIMSKENHNYIYTITSIREKENKYECGVTFVLRFSEQDNWELVPDKFDITSMKPFDKVLVRMDNKHVWEIQFFERLNTILKDSFVCMGRERYHQCIPYDGNEHLLNTAKDCEDYFKTWE